MRFATRVDQISGEHVHFSVFVNGVNAGKLWLRIQEYNEYKLCLEIGAMRTLDAIAFAPPKPEEIQLALNRLFNLLEENSGTYLMTEIVEDFKTIKDALGVTNENLTAAPKDGPSSPSDPRQDLGSDRTNAEQFQRNRNNQSPSGDSGIQESSHNGGLRENSGGSSSVSSEGEVSSILKSAPRPESSNRRFNPLDFFTASPEDSKARGGSSQLDGIQTKGLVESEKLLTPNLKLRCN